MPYSRKGSIFWLNLLMCFFINCLKNMRSTYDALKEISNYCQSTSAHGFQYLVTSGSHLLLEKLFWAACILSGFILSGFIIKSSVDEWRDKPVLITMETPAYPVTRIQFPTVTICPGKYKINILHKDVIICF